MGAVTTNAPTQDRMEILRPLGYRLIVEFSDSEQARARCRQALRIIRNQDNQETKPCVN